MTLDEQVKIDMKTLRKGGMKGPLIAERLGVAVSTVWRYTAAVEKGFEDSHDYVDSLAREKGYRNHNSYVRTQRAIRLGFKSHKEYKKHQRGQKTRALARFSKYLNQELDDRCQGSTWLGREINVSRQVINNYLQGENLPNPEIRKRIFDFFSAPDKLRRTFEK